MGIIWGHQKYSKYHSYLLPGPNNPYKPILYECMYMNVIQLCREARTFHTKYKIY